MIKKYAVFQVSRTFKVDLEKARNVNNHWWEHAKSYETTDDVIGKKIAKKDDRRRRLTQEQQDQLQKFINDEHKAERQVFRRTHYVFHRTEADWMYWACSTETLLSNRAIEGLTQRLVCRHRRGRIKTPPLDVLDMQHGDSTVEPRGRRVDAKARV